MGIGEPGEDGLAILALRCYWPFFALFSELLAYPGTLALCRQHEPGPGLGLQLGSSPGSPVFPRIESVDFSPQPWSVLVLLQLDTFGYYCLFKIGLLFGCHVCSICCDPSELLIKV